MAKKGVVIIADYSETHPVSFDELCEICNLTSDIIDSLIEYEIIHPEGKRPAEWEFDMTQLQRVKTAMRLRRDLEVNFAGIALVLDLLDQMEEMRTQIELLERHR